MAKITSIMFDLDDTLLWDAKCVDESFQATCQIAAKSYDIDPAKLEKSVKEQAVLLYRSFPTYDFTRNIGINPFEGLWGNFNDSDPRFSELRDIVPQYRKDAWINGLKSIGIDDHELGVKLADQFPRERRSRSIVYFDTYSTLEALKGKYRLLLLTNGSPELQKEKLSAEPKLASYFDHILISGSFGEGKPAKPLFMHALALLESKPEETVMIGDKLTTDVLGALNSDVHSVWLNRTNHESNDQIVPMFEINELQEIFHILDELNLSER